MPTPRQPARSSNFSAAFERMCNFVAISQTKSIEETLRELILQCFVVLPDETFVSASEIAEAVETLFGLQIAPEDINAEVDVLVSMSSLSRPTGMAYVLDSTWKLSLQKRLDEATALEERVRTQWFDELSSAHPALPQNVMWKSLRGYLAKSFRRHGLQAAAYLDPSIETNGDHDNSLKVLLNTAVSEAFQDSVHLRDEASKAISAFLASVGDHEDRISYIAQLADGAFNYYSLTVDPEVAQRFRENLEPITLFLDTNFLFGILDLHAHPLVEVSNQLLESIETYRLPFTLRYHAVTEREARATIGYYGDRLRNRNWTQKLSRAAASTRSVSGIELRYHQKNSSSPIDVESFLRPYEHFDVLLKEHQIDIYRGSSNNRHEEQAEILEEYISFLAAKHRTKPDVALDHDVTVLDAAHEMRDRAPSSLAAGALLLTCDYLLYIFEQEYSRRHSRKSSVLLPNLFMQMLRPFLPSTADFDRSFAETFAIPEFRIIGSGRAKAASRLMSMLAAYSGVSEQVAVSMLSNDLLLEKLAPIENGVEFQAIVDAEFVNLNNTLAEEKAALEQQLERKRIEQEQRNLENMRQLEATQSALQEETQAKRSALEKAENERRAAASALQDAEREKLLKAESERKAKDEQEKRLKAENQLRTIYNSLVVVLGALVGIGTYFALNLWQWDFLVNHQNRIPLQVSASIAAVLSLVGLLRPEWRSVCWGSGTFFAVVLLLVSLLGN